MVIFYSKSVLSCEDAGFLHSSPVVLDQLFMEKHSCRSLFAFTANAKQSSLVAREFRSYWMHPRSRMLVAKNIAALPGSTRFSNAVNQHLYM